MGLGKKRGGEDKIEVPMSSMIDVVFLLLIYFIVTYKEEIPEAHLQVNLPAPNTQQTSDTPPTPPIELRVYRDEYRLRGTPMFPETIKQALGALAASDPEITVVIQTSVFAPMKNLITILDICQAVNLKNLNVMTLD
jgi:biopolymer transport protein ExbD